MAVHAVAEAFAAASYGCVSGAQKAERGESCKDRKFSMQVLLKNFVVHAL